MDVELRLVEPARNRRRLYAMREAETLFGEPCLVITWGRIGARCRERTEVFGSRAERAERREELLSRRRQHGYVASYAAA